MLLLATSVLGCGDGTERSPASPAGVGGGAGTSVGASGKGGMSGSAAAGKGGAAATGGVGSGGASGKGTSGAGGAGGAGGAAVGGAGGSPKGGLGGAGGAAGKAGGGAAGAQGGGSSGRPFPDTSDAIAILADQLPTGMSAGQQQFAATHFVGSQKLVLDVSKPLRAINPGFLVLHYHLGIWQSAPSVSFIVDGTTWGNDFPTVDANEAWFWHNPEGKRVASTADQKLLMNLADPAFRAYWAKSIAAQTKAGDYDGVFADSSSPPLLQGEVGGQDARLAGTGVKDSPIAEWGGKTYIQVWQDFMVSFDSALAAEGIPLIPNEGDFVTTWDPTNYALTAGVFSEGFASPSFSTADWKASTNQLLALSASKILILQNYLGSAADLAVRRFYLANYLLVRGARTYLDYFAKGPLEWYPEWGIDTGAAKKTATKVDELLTPEGAYRRDFAKATVLVNPTDLPITVALGSTMKRVEPQGGGAIDTTGATPGTLGGTATSSIVVPPHGAEILIP